MRRPGRQAAEPPPLAAVPPVDARVELSWPGTGRRPYRSLVDEHGAGTFAVLAPLPGPDLPALDVGPVTVSWQTARGITELRTVVVATGASGTVPLWWLVPAGPPCFVQRRSFVRVPATVIVRLEGPDGPTAAVSTDISEGGVGCWLPGEVGDPWAFTQVTLPLAERTLVAAIRPIRVDGHPGRDRLWLGAGFVDLSDADATELRRHVYQRQISLRRRMDRAG